jgi:hypothetical protein
MGSLAEPKPPKYCAACGSVAAGGARYDILGDQVPLCVSCTTQVRAGAGLEYSLPTRELAPLPVPEGFSELFQAARMLLEEDAPENQIIPTLALANHLSHGVPRLITERDRFKRLEEDEQAWEAEAHGFARRYGGLRPVRMAQDVLILERRPILAAVGYAFVSKRAVEAVVTVYPHRTPLATSEEIAAEYSKVLSTAGVTCDERRTGHLSYAFVNRRLEISIRPGTAIEPTTTTKGTTVPKPGWRSDEASFPTPLVVGGLCTALAKALSAGGFGADLPKRGRGKAPEAENLIPACVAFLLKEYGVQPDKEINALLAEHVLGAGWKSGRQPHEIGQFRSGDRGSSSLHEQMWRDARNDYIVRDPLTDASWTLFWEGFEE